MSQIVLASASPRRRDLLSAFIKNITIHPVKHEEKVFQGEDAKTIAMSLAYEKALIAAEDFPNSIVIGADTLVVCDGQILGKPADEADARKMINSLSGTVHQVITGIAVINLEKNLKVVDYESTDVHVAELSEEDIQYYLATGEYQDKAGAYGIQAYFAPYIEGVDGDYFNVVGLPLHRLHRVLVTYFNVHLLKEGQIAKDEEHQKRGDENGN